MANEKKIKIVVDANGAQRATSALQTQLGKLGLKVEGLNGSLDRMGKSLPILSKLGAGISAAALAVAAYANATANAVVLTDNLAKNAGISTKKFQAWEAATKSLNITSEELSQTLADVSERVGEFTRTGGGEFKDVYEQYIKPMGVSIKALEDMKPDEVLNLIKKGMDEAGASANEMKSALEQVASNASHMTTALDGTGKSINTLYDAMDRDGKLFDDDDIAKSRELTKQVAELQIELKAIGTEIGLFLVEPVTAAAGAVNSIIDKIRDSVRFMQSIIKSAEDLGYKYLSTDAQRANIDGMKEQESNDAFVNKSATDGKEAMRKIARAEAIAARLAETDAATATKKAQVQAENNARELEALRVQAAAYLEQVAQLGMDEFELIEANLASKKSILDSYMADGVISATEHATAINTIQQAAADASYEILFNEAEKEKRLAEKSAKDKAKIETDWNKQISKGNMSLAKESLSLIASTTKEGSALRAAAMIAEKGIAISQIITQYEIAAAMAMAQLGPVAGAPVAATMKAQAGVSVGLVAAQGIAEMASSRQSGGYMQANTPYQVGGGAHTDTPEMYQSGGKSYIVDSQAGMMKRVSGNASTGGVPRVSMTINNSGDPINLQQQSATMDEEGVLNLIYERVPSILRDQAGNDQSDFSKAFGSIRNQDWSFS